MSSINVKIFFDESGKGNNSNDQPTIMGGLLIPENVYNSPNIQRYNENLKSGDFTLHWTKYSGDNRKKKIIKEIMVELMRFSDLIDFNVILYNKPSDNENISSEDFNNMRYAKLPERIFYGLLRLYGSKTNIKAQIYIENATEYKRIKLDDKIKEQLNIQSIYRGENFKIESCHYESKNNEIGVEITDLLLGIVRTIIQNNYGQKISKTKNAKNDLIIELLKIEAFYHFLTNIKFFEWNNTRKLENIDFEGYLKIFLSCQEKWLNHITTIG